MFLFADLLLSLSVFVAFSSVVLSLFPRGYSFCVYFRFLVTSCFDKLCFVVMFVSVGSFWMFGLVSHVPRRPLCILRLLCALVVFFGILVAFLSLTCVSSVCSLFFFVCAPWRFVVCCNCCCCEMAYIMYYIRIHAR